MSRSYFSAFLCDVLYSLPMQTRGQTLLGALASQSDCSLECRHDSNFFRRGFELYWEKRFKRAVPFWAIEKLLDGPKYRELELHILELNTSESRLELSMKLAGIADCLESEIRKAAKEKTVQGQELNSPKCSDTKRNNIHQIRKQRAAVCGSVLIQQNWDRLQPHIRESIATLIESSLASQPESNSHD